MSRIIKQVQVGVKPVVINNPKMTPDHVHVSAPVGNVQAAPGWQQDKSRIIGAEPPKESPRVVSAEPPDARIDSVALANQELENSKAEAKAIVDAAEAKAAQIIEDAKAEVEALKQQIIEESHQQGLASGHKEGFDQGYQEGLSQGRQEALDQMQETLNTSTHQAAELLHYANQQASDMLVQAERQIIELCLAIAQKVIGQQLAENDHAIISLVKAALDKVRDQEKITIRVSPADYELVLKAQQELDKYIEREHTINLMPDLAIVSGGCIIETAYGTVDARIDTQLDALKKALREIMP